MGRWRSAGGSLSGGGSAGEVEDLSVGVSETGAEIAAGGAGSICRGIAGGESAIKGVGRSSEDGEEEGEVEEVIVGG